MQESSVIAKQHTQRGGRTLLLTSVPKRVFITYTGAVLLGLCFSLASYLILFLTPDQTQGPPQYVCASFGQDGFQSKVLWEGYQDLL